MSVMEAGCRVRTNVPDEPEWHGLTGTVVGLAGLVCQGGIWVDLDDNPLKMPPDYRMMFDPHELVPEGGA